MRPADCFPALIRPGIQADLHSFGWFSLLCLAAACTELEKTTVNRYLSKLIIKKAKKGSAQLEGEKKISSITFLFAHRTRACNTRASWDLPFFHLLLLGPSALLQEVRSVFITT